jgi:site-specific recombinase XerD
MKDMLGRYVHDFFTEYLKSQKGLRQSTVCSYRDAFRLFLPFVSQQKGRPISKIAIEDLDLDVVLAFLKHLEVDRKNCIASRNQRRAALRTFFEFLGRRDPALLHLYQRISSIPTKRSPLPDTNYIDILEVEKIFKSLPTEGILAKRDRALLLFFYNTGARVQEVADLKVEQLDLTAPGSVRIHGKGGKWRSCPLTVTTCTALMALVSHRSLTPSDFLFCNRKREPMTRFGIYKRVRLLTRGAKLSGTRADRTNISPHVWRHTTAVHLLEAGNEANVISAWLGHVSLETTNRYAQITMRMKAQAMKHCMPELATLKAPWKDDPSLMQFLASI